MTFWLAFHFGRGLYGFSKYALFFLISAEVKNKNSVFHSHIRRGREEDFRKMRMLLQMFQLS